MFNFIYNDFQYIFFRIEALLLSVALFFVGFIYKDAPVEISYTVSINGTEISAEESLEIPLNGRLDVSCLCENTGRPFEGTIYHEPQVYFYKIENGEKIPLSRWSYTTDEVRTPVLVKSGEKFTGSECSNLAPDAQSGTYTLEISLYGNKQVYKNVLTVV